MMQHHILPNYMRYCRVQGDKYTGERAVSKTQANYWTKRKYIPTLNELRNRNCITTMLRITHNATKLLK